VSVKHLNQRQLADRWDVSEATLERWRSEGIGPVFLKLQGRVLIASRTSRPSRPTACARAPPSASMREVRHEPSHPDQVLATPAGELAELASESLFQLKNDAADLLAAAKAIVEHVDRALDLKYADRAHQLRWRPARTPASSISMTATCASPPICPRRSSGTRSKLADITRRIAANGDDPSEYVEISYRISETKFNAWPESLKSAFAPARTLKTGKPGFRLALLQE
jgi:hypothetical protein